VGPAGGTFAALSGAMGFTREFSFDVGDSSSYLEEGSSTACSDA